MVRRFGCVLALLIAVAPLAQVTAAEPAAKTATFPGKASNWAGFERHDFQVDGRNVIVVSPKQAAPGKPWIWRARFWGHRPEVDQALLAKGFHLVYMDVANLYGCPDAVAHWNAFYEYLTTKHGFAKKVALEGMSRGGLIIYNWAAANPDKVACIYADAPVCDFKSWPGGKGNGKGSAGDWGRLIQAYHFKSQAEALAYAHNPIDNLKPLAEAKIPLLHVCGDVDNVVPMAENTLVLKKRYEELGGKMTLIVKKGIGHKHGLDDATPIVEFVLENAVGK